MKKEIYTAVTGVIAILFTIILWFGFLSTSTWTISTTIDTAIAWLVGVIFLTLAGGIVGYLGTYIKALLKIEDEETIWDAILGIVQILITLIVWLGWLELKVYTFTSVLDVGITWIVIMVIIGLGEIIIEWFVKMQEKIFPAIETKIAKK